MPGAATASRTIVPQSPAAKLAAERLAAEADRDPSPGVDRGPGRALVPGRSAYTACHRFF